MAQSNVSPQEKDALESLLSMGQEGYQPKRRRRLTPQEEVEYERRLGGYSDEGTNSLDAIRNKVSLGHMPTQETHTRQQKSSDETNLDRVAKTLVKFLDKDDKTRVDQRVAGNYKERRSIIRINSTFDYLGAKITQAQLTELLNEVPGFQVIIVPVLYGNERPESWI